MIEEKIDHEVLKIISTCYNETLELLRKKRDKLEAMAGMLLEQEVLEARDVKELLGKVPAGVPT
jgi:ATP-dependent Zn protease